MSRRANITSVAIALLAVQISACRSARPASHADSLVTVVECVGDVVPLCATLHIRADGFATYERRGLRTRQGWLRPEEIVAVRETLQSADVLAFEGNDRASGSLVNIRTAAGTRTFPIAQLPHPVAPFLEEIHRIGKRIFGRSFGSI